MNREHDATIYGKHTAADYDLLYGDLFDTDGAVDRLTQLAGTGPILEWGVGTGRLALGLVDRGFEVFGLDSSVEMLEILARKPGGGRVTTTLGDFSSSRVAGSFALVVLAINTLFALPDQETQVRCFSNAADHLAPGGRFVMEAWIPDIGAFTRNSRISSREIGGDEVAIVLADHAPATQQIRVTQVHIGPNGCRLFPMQHRYAWPAELDLMAQLAGLHLESRWSDWRGTAFGDRSTAHVSVYRKPD